MIKIVRFNLSLMLGFVLTAATASAAATLGPFRAPAIPLFTTDPYMQTWMMGDNTTAVSGNVKKKRRKRKEKKKHATTSSMPFTQDLAASLASGGRASTRNFVSPLPHHSVHSCTYTHLYLYTIPLLFFLPQEFACAAHVLCSQCLGCSAQCWSTSTATTHKRGTPQRFAISENLALLETYNRLGPPQLDLPSCMHCLPNWAPLCKPLYPSAPLQ